MSPITKENSITSKQNKKRITISIDCKIDLKLELLCTLTKKKKNVLVKEALEELMKTEFPKFKSVLEEMFQPSAESLK